MSEEQRATLEHRVEEVLTGAKRYVVLNVDARRLAEVLPVNRFHVLLTDVPYGISAADLTYTGGRELTRDFQEMKPHQIDAMVKEVISGVMPAVVSDGLAYSWCADRQFGMLYGLMATWGFQPGFLVWSKPNPAPSARKSTWVSSAELCVRGRRKGAPYAWEEMPDSKSQGLNFNVITLACRAHPSGHPNEKPVELMRRILRKHVLPGEVVLDPFCGSGAVGEAALQLGARYVGVDISAKWAAYADQRLAAMPHFDPAQVPTLVRTTDEETGADGGTDGH